MSDGAADRSRDYVAYMRCDAGDDWMTDATAQVSAWLREKGLDVDLTAWGDHSGSGASLRVRPLNEARSQDLHLELREETPQGTWGTDLVIHDERGGHDWISLEVRNDEGRYVDVPRLAKYLMGVLPLGDGLIDFTDRPQTFRSDDVERLVDILADSTRHGLVFVAGTDDNPELRGAFSTKVGEWARDVYGLAQVVVLNPEATTAFAGRVGPGLAAPAWTIRTYHPGVALEDPHDARRHRILGTQRLATQPDRAISRLLGDVARQQAALRPTSPSLLRAQRRLARLETARLVDTALPESAAEAAPSEVSTSLELSNLDVAVLTDVAAAPSIEAAPSIDTTLEMICRVLEIESVTEESLSEIVNRARRRSEEVIAAHELRFRIDSLQSELEAAQDDNQALHTALEDSQTETEIAHLDLDNREARVRWLESRLKERGDYDAAYLDVPREFEIDYPSDFDALLGRIRDMDGVTFTGDVSEVEKLNQIDTNDAALRAACEAVLALSDYVRARRQGDCDKGLDYYLAHTPPGYQSMPPKKFASTETGVTMQQFGGERIFPVPTAVDPSGAVTMKAHFKLARIGMVAPRMHVYDAHPAIPEVFIGYLGPHLTNTQTKRM